MTTLSPPPEPPVATPPRRRRRPAPKAHPFWRFVFPLLVVAAAVAVYSLWRWGTESVLDSSDGRVVDGVPTDPAAPGYKVFVDPTPTMLLLAVADDGQLAGVTFLARTDLERGGAAGLFPPGLVVAPGDDSPGALLGAAYAGEGTDAVERLAEELLRVGFAETVVMDEEQLAGWFRPLGSIPYLVVDDLTSISPRLQAGTRVELDPEEAAEVYMFLADGEADANRIERQAVLWETWLELIARAPAEDVDLLTLPFDEGLSPYLRSLGRGSSRLESIPAAAVPLDDNPPVYAIDDAAAAWVTAFVLDTVPSPRSPRSFSRTSVELLDGTGDPANRTLVERELVGAGAVVQIVGNADMFGVAETTVSYHAPEVADRAQVLAEALGADAVFIDDPFAPADVTVVVGDDRAVS